jgi:hypothetical protein
MDSFPKPEARCEARYDARRAARGEGADPVDEADTELPEVFEAHGGVAVRSRSFIGSTSNSLVGDVFILVGDRDSRA